MTVVFVEGWKIVKYLKEVQKKNEKEKEKKAN